MTTRRNFLSGGLVAAGGLIIPTPQASSTTSVITQAQEHITNLVVKTAARTVNLLDVDNAMTAVTNIIQHFDQVSYWEEFHKAIPHVPPTTDVFREHYIAMSCWQHTHGIVPSVSFEEVNHTFLQLRQINPLLPYDTLIANNRSILTVLSNGGLRPVLVNANHVLTAFRDRIVRGPTASSPTSFTNPGDPGACIIAQETLLLLSFAAGIVSFLCFATVILFELCLGWTIIGLLLLAIRIVVAVICGI